jgi:hypothetical protein
MPGTLVNDIVNLLETLGPLGVSFESCFDRRAQSTGGHSTESPGNHVRNVL